MLANQQGQYTSDQKGKKTNDPHYPPPGKTSGASRLVPDDKPELPERIRK
jgi:hypothetical protein